MVQTLIDEQRALDEVLQSPRIPRATYRVQLNQDFTFADTAAIIDYLHDLGISDLYTSPLFKPRAGSTHGYDTVDYNQFNPVLGGEDGFNGLSSTLHERGMGLLLDIVPNHMGVSTDNVWWMDVLKHGPSSIYAHYFDIDWRPQNRAIDDKVLLPVLGDHYGRVLEAGEFELVYWHGDFYLHYYENQFPITPETYADVLERVHTELVAQPHDPYVEEELSSIITALGHLPPYTSQYQAALVVRRREQVVIRRRLLALFDRSEAFRAAVFRALETLNGHAGEPESFDALDHLLSRQPYRLSYWRVAADEINYRRFFDINDMAAIRIEDYDVFADTHRLAFRLLGEGKVNGLRVDHPDGLWNPRAYFMQLQEEYVAARMAHVLGHAVTNRAPISERLNVLANEEALPSDWPLYVLVEKILSETEPLPYSWAVYGTTGYDFMNAVNLLLVDPENEAAFDALYGGFTGQETDFHRLTDRTKKLVMNTALTSEIDARSAQLDRILEHNRRYRGFTRNSLAFGLSEIIAGLPIYRTYITGPGDISERDRHYIEQAVEEAKARNPLTPGGIFDFLRETLLLANLGDFEEDQRADLREFVMKFQQITGPVMAKSVEDTAFYVYNRLVSLNEVGGHPDVFGSTVEDFHQHNREKAFPHTMLSTSTHDTKRSEDVRARISVLSEMPDLWRRTLESWSAINAPHKVDVAGEPAPDPNDEYLLYQTLLGAYPLDEAEIPDFKGRVVQYMHKAINEAKQRSSWVNPNLDYAKAIETFLGRIMDDPRFRASFDPFQASIAYFGLWNSLSQTLLKLTCPGTPDIYQGNELWDFSLVDPDNRRPVDYDLRRGLLGELRAEADSDLPGLCRRLVGETTRGDIKLHVTYRALNYRCKRDTLFREGEYIPLDVFGVKSRHVCAFLRRYQDQTALVVVPRLVYGLTGGEMTAPLGTGVWEDTRLLLPEGFDATSFASVLTGERLSLEREGQRMRLYVSQALSLLPVGLLDAVTVG